MAAFVHLWRGCVALLSWILKLLQMRKSSSSSSTSLPSAMSSTSSFSYCAVGRLFTYNSHRARQQSHAALELLEKFRHGPETQSEWNLLLWRATFPLVSLVLLTLLCVAGQFGHVAYSFVIHPVWYFCNLVLMTSPFLLVFQFTALVEEEDQMKLWYGLGIISGAISLIEWYMSMPASRYSWIVGNTLFGIVALGAIPLFFSMQRRVPRSQYEDLVMEQELDQRSLELDEEKSTGSSLSFVDEDLRTMTRGFVRQRLGEGRNVHETMRQARMGPEHREGQPATRLLVGCGCCALVLWLVMFSSYSVPRREDPSASSSRSSESWLKLAISVLYLFLMQGYFFVITYMVNSMSEPFAHPSLLYVGQLYYYVFWYILVGSDTPIDALYWGMLFLNNVHIAFLNTGVYTDFKRTSSGWLAMPLHAYITSSIALCVRSTTSVMRISKKPLQRQGLLGLNCGVAGAAAMETNSDLSHCENDLGYGSDSFMIARAFDESKTFVDELPLWQETVSRNRERDRNVNGIRRDTTPSVPGISSLLAPKTPKTDTCKTSINRECSRAQMNCRKCVGGRPSESPRSGNGNMASFPRSATSDALRPLYFLMKLAEQDNMADTTALILVPSLLTLLAVFEKPGNVLSVLQAQTNLWLRCVCMFIGRLGGAFLAREIFTCKLRSRLRVSNNLDKASQSDRIGGSIDGMPARLWIQRLMLQDFHAQFWYLTAVTIVVTFGCFARVDVPLRFALLS
ncbi:hypothetical protein PsorP6_002494 [Peronosclerospora sorghi]|uniref:Uncharacterized protein n=1 Tax=Peronosclerospora sorghi TaxID=230839 RepID=A0ACC0WUN7_9STRA|nr:hypothetical protein PsorP6_002494 [Peronosclerospora sorghi]